MDGIGSALIFILFEKVLIWASATSEMHIKRQMIENVYMQPSIGIFILSKRERKIWTFATLIQYLSNVSRLLQKNTKMLSFM